MEENKRFIVLQTRVEDGVIWVYGFLDDVPPERLRKIPSYVQTIVKRYGWYKLIMKDEKESA